MILQNSTAKPRRLAQSARSAHENHTLQSSSRGPSPLCSPAAGCGRERY
jgi:hypothetical protein